MKNFVFILTLFLSGFTGTLCSEHGDPMEITPFIYEDAIEEGLIEFLTPYENITIAALPTIAIQPENDTRIDLSLTLGSILITGISDLTVNSLELQPIRQSALFEITMHGIKFFAGYYKAAGHVNTLPFNGESYMRAGVEDLNVKLNIRYELRPVSGKVCFDYGTTVYDISVRKPEMYFDSLNPGTDIGQSLNVIMTGMIYDVVDYVQFLLNGHEFLQFDATLVDVLNSVLCPEDPEEI